jgi:hypothetical protein
MDISGEVQYDVDHDIYKKRLTLDGRVISEERESNFVFLSFFLFVFISNTQKKNSKTLFLIMKMKKSEGN